jgi:prepilin-type processing-associated H-X9-DG protein/prepilin-type N-terminal cleavage/methylation domain-containing protein
MTPTHSHQVSVRTDRLGLRQRSAGGFTLIEVLVVVAIIALLVSILLPSLQRAREQTKSLVCRTNMKTIHQAMTIYLNQNLDFFPYDATPSRPSVPDSAPNGANPWEMFYKCVQKGIPRHMTAAEVQEKAPILRTQFPDPPFFWTLLDWYVCAKDKYYHVSNQTGSLILPDGTTVDPTYALSYCITDYVCYTFRKDENGVNQAIGSQRASSIKRQSDMVLAGEYVDDTHVMRAGWILSDHGNDLNWGDVNQIEHWEVRHLGGGNILFLDGHVAFHRLNWSDTSQWGLPPFPQCFIANWQRPAGWDPTILDRHVLPPVP